MFILIKVYMYPKGWRGGGYFPTFQFARTCTYTQRKETRRATEKTIKSKS